ncbi:MAG: hypothetical protein J5I90_16400 [Caldilineales bacterium]|nr:hypothetical protein [Caldilineales bacterium]
MRLPLPCLFVMVLIAGAALAALTSARFVAAAGIGGDDLQQWRITTQEEGIYRLTYDDLLEAGLPVDDLDPARFSMHYLGEPVDILVTGAEDDRFDTHDLIIFFAQPYQGRYMLDNIYWLTLANASGQRMGQREVRPTGAESVVTSTVSTLHIEYDRDYRSDYSRAQDADHWFDLPLNAVYDSPTVTRTYTFTLDHVLPTGVAGIDILVHGGQSQEPAPDQSLALQIGETELGLFQWDGSEDYLVQATFPADILYDGENAMSISASLAQLGSESGVNHYWISPDWAEIRYPAMAISRQDRLLIEGVAEGNNRIEASGFSTPDVLALDVSDPSHPVEIRSTAGRAEGNSHTFIFWDSTPAAARYVLSAQSALLSPASIEPDRPSNLHNRRQSADYIAIVHRSLWDVIDPLLAHRTAEGFIIAKVDVQDIYDEYAFGRVDPEAIRRFLADAHRNWTEGGDSPRFVLLVGDGHYDFRGVSGTAQPNLIPPYLLHIDPWLGETAADNRYVSIDGPDDYLPDMHIGRIPARTPEDVIAVVDKILAYENAPAGDWQKRILFAADRTAGFDADFQAISDEIRREWLPQAYDDRQLYYQVDQTNGDGMRAAFKQAFDESALVVQWFGHASRFRWGSDSMFNIFDPASLQQNAALPVTFTYACWSGYFVNLFNDWQSLGETLLLTPGRGSVADFSPAGLHVGGSLAVLNQGIIKAIYRDKAERLGEAIDAGKYYFYNQSPAWHDLIDTSILFGDPALKLRLPQNWHLDQSRLDANRDKAEAGDVVEYTLNVVNSSNQALTDVNITVDYDERFMTVVDAGGGEDDDGRLWWALGTTTPGATTLVFSLQVGSLTSHPQKLYIFAELKGTDQLSVKLVHLLQFTPIPAGDKMFLPRLIN